MAVNRMIKIENLIMSEALKAMQILGGQVTRKEVRREIRDHSEVISEEMVDEIVKSKKTGEPYHPFEYRFNFAVKYLITTGFITTEDNRNLELSEKGRMVKLEEFDPMRDVRAVLDKNTADDDSEEDAETEEEPWRSELLAALAKMSPQKFEMFSRGLLSNMGVDLDDNIGVRYIGDGGLDGFGYITSDDFRTTRVALQAKRWDGKVSAPEIDKFRGAMDKYNAEYGIFITTSDFTRDALKTAKEGTRVITLINGDKICDLVAKYRYYVEPVTTYRLKSFFTDNE
ncbi:restriction endonuclease [Ligilactobacillus hayakitensis DSM 18933 = JCM 14209]|uniref:Restriction endonuclease n=1 Tax=Ligilactobacillus hayakitensis DSM 18933 = JCM 14209 TaxID=1423755 RepID=A0A0R1WY60_9LACO|nr:Mrr restriction system protein [Ligilactobacillus hayakitensis]KRM20377.1 restriction endonuclease [Ligilactobacillus hayakitensis DSM 18933 = JCM 14209]